MNDTITLVMACAMAFLVAACSSSTPSHNAEQELPVQHAGTCPGSPAPRGGW